MKHRKHRKVLAALALALAAVLVTGCAPAKPPGQVQNPQAVADPAPEKAPAVVTLVQTQEAPAATQAPAAVPAATEPQSAAKKVTLEEAKGLALAHLGLKEATWTGSDADDGAWELELISGETEYDVDVRISDGKILRVEKEPVRSGKPAAQVPAATEPATQTPAATEPKPAAKKVTLEEAKAAALAHLGLKDVRWTDLEADDGVWELELVSGRTEYDVKVRISDGKILKAEKDWDD